MDQIENEFTNICLFSSIEAALFKIFSNRSTTLGLEEYCSVGKSVGRIFEF